MANNIRAVDHVTTPPDAKRAFDHKNKETLFKLNDNEIELKMSIDEEDLSKAVERVNTEFMTDDKRVEYSFHDETNTYVVKLIDKETDEVIKQIPSQKMLDIAAGLMNYMGINVDEVI